MDPISPNGKAVLTLKSGTGLAAAVLTMITTTTLPALYAAGVAVPAWIPVVLGAALGTCIIVAQWSGGLRTKRPKKGAASPIPGTVPAPVPPEVKP